MSAIWDNFDWKQGSKVWPSSDPNDSPFDDFRCRACGYQFRARVNGTYALSGPSLGEQVSTLMRDHLRECATLREHNE